MRKFTKVVLMAALLAGSSTMSGVQAQPAAADPAACGYSEDDGYAYWGNCGSSTNDYIQVDRVWQWDAYYCVPAHTIMRVGGASNIRGARIIYYGCNP